MGPEDKSGMVLTITVVDIPGNICIQMRTDVDSTYMCAHAYL